ncbi:hypothetical protein LNTAR_16908 [Lentisphaera araneosa HTCC2155]|uniref:Uncharacterized protein n=1 Tax=Lentisphaera araneosa HTCC2155 TaxID=313628 RepID=A6DF70_9BACT|nr:glycoside hydrolase family protein [Lentisphaera araneosa]EDM29450.1 hypothetical protein LNTAR_16908 [Lentisphaera araneosa HTCC2155]
MHSFKLIFYFLITLLCGTTIAIENPLAGDSLEIKYFKLDANVQSDFYAQKTNPHVLVDPDYFIWGMAVIKWNDGKYHSYYSRWPKKRGFSAWMTHCEIAHAVADNPEGPFKYVNTVIEGKNLNGWDINNAHNPSICVVDGKIALYYISNDLRNIYKTTEKNVYPTDKWLKNNRSKVRNSQRIGVALSDSPSGPFIRSKEPVVTPHGNFKNIAVNPAVTYLDGKYVMVMKGDDVNKDGWFRIQLVGHSSKAQGPFVFQKTPVYSEAQTEDAGLWYDKKLKRFYMACHVMEKPDLRLFSSKDSYSWQPARQVLFSKKEFSLSNHKTWQPSRFERPFILTNNMGSPIAVYIAVFDKKRNISGNITILVNNE